MTRDNGAAVATSESDQGLEWLRCALGLEASQTPFPWQIEVLRRFRQGDVVSALDVPTGLGKTAVMAVWLVARALGAKLPRRLVYVVDRRAVVDQATEVAEALRAWVTKESAVAAALGLGDRPLPISTLRGQHVDNRAWLEDPSSPAIVVGTVDMVGSRLLFSGYGVSSKMRPYHAGLLGADTLVVLDEAHLVPAFEDLLRQVEAGAASFGPRDVALRPLVPPFKLLSLSATGRQTTDATPSLTLSEADRRNAIVSKRLNAKKTLIVVDLANAPEVPSATDERPSEDDASEDDKTKKDKGPKLAAVLAKQAWELTAQGSLNVRCLVFCNARKEATAVAAELRNLAKSASATDPTIELFVGGRRVKERVEARDALARLGFLAGASVALERSAFLVATSAGEVGVDLDADHVVCDLVAWERMVQRLGRANRRGDGDAKVVVVVEDEPMPSDGAKKALEKRNASNTAKNQLAELTTKWSTLQGERTPAPRGQKKSADAKAADEKRKQDEKELKKQLSACQKRLKAFKDADAKVVARHEAATNQRQALRKLLAQVGEGGSLSPEALLKLRASENLVDALRDATTAEPLRPELTRPLVDAWSMTSLEEHPGRPDVDPWLRGFRPNDPPRTTVVWRRHLPVRADGAFDTKAAKRFFEAAPPHACEQLETETHVVLAWLVDRAAAVSETKDEEAVLNAKQVVAIALGARGELRGWRTLEQLTAAKSKGKKESKEAKKDREQATKQLDALLAGATLIIDARLGGLTRVVATIEEARGRVLRTVNGEMVLSYWHVGREIVEYVQRGEARAEYGELVIEDLSVKLAERVGRGYSTRNLRYFRDFYTTYRDRAPTIRTEGFRTSLVQNSKARGAATILHEARAEFAEGFSARLSWTHYRALLSVKEPAARAFYEIEAEPENWSTPHLERQIHSPLHLRLLKSRNKEGVMDLTRRGQMLIDLKIGKLTQRDVGQMDSYVRIFDAHQRAPGDGPTIDLIRCAEENHTIAPVLAEHEQLFAAKYLTYLPNEEELRRELERDHLFAGATVERPRKSKKVATSKRTPKRRKP